MVRFWTFSLGWTRFVPLAKGNDVIHSSLLANWSTQMSALWAIRILRKFPHTWRFDRHLDDCAALAVWTPLFDSVPPLRLAHVLKLIPLPCLNPSFSDSMNGGVEIPMLPENVVWLRSKQHPEIFNGISASYDGPQPSA